MKKRRTEEPEKENGDRWLLTYSDLITLLMIFFVVLYSMSIVDANKFKAMAESLSVTLGSGTPSTIDLATDPAGPSMFETGSPTSQATVPGTTDDSDNTVDTEGASGDSSLSEGNFTQENMTIEQIKVILDKYAVDNGIQTKLVTSIEERGLVVSIQDTLLFESGSATITPSARQILNQISFVLATSPNYIKVEGHTDNLPIRTEQFPSNWELSVLRATNVVHIMSTEGGISPERLSATGYGEYRPIVSNDTEAGRARNRRVDLVILRSKYDLTEPSNHNPGTGTEIDVPNANFDIPSGL